MSGPKDGRANGAVESTIARLSEQHRIANDSQKLHENIPTRLSASLSAKAKEGLQIEWHMLDVLRRPPRP